MCRKNSISNCLYIPFKSNSTQGVEMCPDNFHKLLINFTRCVITEPLPHLKPLLIIIFFRVETCLASKYHYHTVQRTPGPLDRCTVYDDMTASGTLSRGNLTSDQHLSLDINRPLDLVDLLDWFNSSKPSL